MEDLVGGVTRPGTGDGDLARALDEAQGGTVGNQEIESHATPVGASFSGVPAEPVAAPTEPVAASGATQTPAVPTGLTGAGEQPGADSVQPQVGDEPPEAGGQPIGGEPGPSTQAPTVTIEGTDRGESWTELLGAFNLNTPVAVAADESGTAYVVGHHFDLVPPDTLTRTAPRIAVFPGDTLPGWTQLIVEMNDGRGDAGDVTVGDGAVYASASVGAWPNLDGVITKFDVANGTRLWSVGLDVLDVALPSGLALDAEGNVLVAGSTYGVTDSGEAEAQRPYVASVSADGQLLWTLVWAEDRGGFASAVAVTATGEVYVTGTYFGDASGHFVAKFSPEGQLLWDRQSPGYGESSGWDVTLDDAGHVLAIGTLDYSTRTAFLQARDPEGEELWTRQWPATIGEFVGALATDGAGTALAATTLEGTQHAAEIRSFDALGEGASFWASESDTWFTADGLAATDAGHVFVVGKTRTTVDGVTQADGYLRRIR